MRRFVTYLVLVVPLLIFSAGCKRIPLHERSTRIDLVIDVALGLDHDINLSYETDLDPEQQEKVDGCHPEYHEVLLYDPASAENRRGEFVANMVKESGAQGLILFMQQFCDPEEMEYPYLKKALEAEGIPHIKLGVDQQMRDFGQASTAIQAFADVL